MPPAPHGSRPLRIFHLTTSGDIVAGAEQLLIGMARLARTARETGTGIDWSLELCTLTSPREVGHGSLFHGLAEHGWPVHSLDIRGPASAVSGLRRLRSLVGTFQPDIVHTHLSHASLFGAVASLDRRVPLVQTRHYSDYVARFRPRRLFADAWAARRADHVIAVSDAAQEQLVRTEHVPPARVSIVENGVEWSRLEGLDQAEGRARLAAAGITSPFVIGCAATFNSRKGHVFLLEAMQTVVARQPGTCLVLLGTGPEEATTRAEVERRGLTEAVHFLGHRADAHALMAGLDLYVQPSIEEGFGLAVLEAMAMRRPVVATAVGGMLKTVEPGRTGLRVPPADPQALAEAILALVGDRERAASLGAAASESVRQHYSLERMLEAYDAVYRAALEADAVTARRVGPRPRSPLAHVRSILEYVSRS